jgi:putative phage-type endonuclease
MRDIYGAPATGDPFTDRRRSGIGGSDAGAILGVSPYRSALGVWEQKRGIGAPVVETERMRWGERLERSILDGYADDYGHVVRHTGRTFRRHPTYRFVIGHPDGMREDGRMLEAKMRDHLDEQWGEEGSDDVPPHYYAQVQHYLFLLGLPIADLAALVRGNTLRVYTIEAHREFTEAMLDEEAALWDRVVSGEPPDPDGSADARRALRDLYSQTVDESLVATPEVAASAAVYLAAREDKNAVELVEEKAAQHIMGFMGARTRVVGVDWRASWLPRAGSTSWRHVAAAYRDLLVTRPNAPSDDELDAIIERSRGAGSRTFTLTRVAPRS